MDTPERQKIDRLLEELAADRTSGAATLYRKILNYLVLGNLGSRDLPERIRALAGDMVPLSYLAGKLENEELFSWRVVAKDLLREHRRENSAIAVRLSKILPAKDSVILTHSNSSTAIDVLRSRRRQIGTIYQTISEPGGEGRASHDSLAQAGLDVRLIDDDQGAAVIEAGALPVLGADCVTEDFFVNKIGSLQLVRAARENGMEPVVVTGTEKLIPSQHYGDRPENPLFERIPLDGIMLIAGDYRFRMSRDPGRLTDLILKGKT